MTHRNKGEIGMRRCEAAYEAIEAMSAACELLSKAFRENVAPQTAAESLTAFYLTYGKISLAHKNLKEAMDL